MLTVSVSFAYQKTSSKVNSYNVKFQYTTKLDVPKSENAILKIPLQHYICFYWLNKSITSAYDDDMIILKIEYEVGFHSRNSVIYDRHQPMYEEENRTSFSLIYPEFIPPRTMLKIGVVTPSNSYITGNKVSYSWNILFQKQVSDLHPTIFYWPFFQLGDFRWSSKKACFRIEWCLQRGSRQDTEIGYKYSVVSNRWKSLVKTPKISVSRL